MQSGKCCDLPIYLPAWLGNGDERSQQNPPERRTDDGDERRLFSTPPPQLKVSYQLHIKGAGFYAQIEKKGLTFRKN
jgi:hypothetical protein